MLRPVQDLLVGTSMSMGTRGSTTGTMMMLTICFDRSYNNEYYRGDDADDEFDDGGDVEI